MQLPADPEFLSSESCDTRILRLSSMTLRITHKPNALAEFPPERLWLHDVLIGDRSPNTEKNFKAFLKGGCLNISNESSQFLFQETHPAEFGPHQQVTLRFHLSSDEGLYGFGEWFNAFRRTSGKLKMMIHDSPAVLQHRQTYSVLPVFLSDRNYAVFVLNSHQAEIALDLKQGLVVLKFDGPPADYLLIKADTPKQILSEYTRLTGRPPLLPLWAYGLWVTSYPQESQEKVLKLVAEHRTRQVPLDGVILDYHWEERFHNFKWRKSLFPDPAELIAKLRSLRVHLGLIFTPFINHTNLVLKKAAINLLFDNLPQGVEQEDERDLAGYSEGHSKGYFADDDASWWFGKGGMLDFTNPMAAAWWNEKLKPLYQSGVSFFKNDDGEYLPLRAKSASGMDGREYHNLYGFYYSRAIYEGMRELDERRPLVYARSVWAGSQRFPAIFLGDQVPNFENLRRTLRAGLNMSLLGFSYWTADVFGLSGKTSPEMHMRYAQWALFSPIARYFLRPDKIDNTRKPWSHSQSVADNFKRHVELRYKLLPYYHHLGWEAWLSGIPHIRPVFMEFPGDKRLLPVYDQVMLGSVLMLCPVVQPRARKRRVIFPAGDWYNFWTDEMIEGNQVCTIDAPLDRLPLFIRGGSILPMGPVMQCIPEDHRFDQLELHIYPPFDKSIQLIDDNPLNREYLKGIYEESNLSVSSSATAIIVTLTRTKDVNQKPPRIRTLAFLFHNVDPVKKIKSGSHNLESWNYDVRKRILTVNVILGVQRNLKMIVQK